MEEERFIAKIAHMYYKQDMDFKEISKVYNISLSTISRLLKRGKEIGIIDININSSSNRLLDLEFKLRKTFNLEEVISINVEENDPIETKKKLVAIEAANYLSNILRDGDILGISWGSTVYEAVNNFKNFKRINVDVVQLHGNCSSVPIELNSSDLVRRMKNMFSGSYYFINSEAIMDSKETRNIIMDDSSLKKTFLLHKSINVALLGIGAFNPESINNPYRDKLKDEEIKEIVRNNIVGEINFTFFDINGNIQRTKLNDRIVTINTENLLKIEKKIVVALGLEKSKSILGALNAKLVNILVTDRFTLENILEKL